jgi:hypothetical protein
VPVELLVTRTSLPGADPDAASWLITLALFAAGVAGFAVVLAVGSGDRRARVFWLGVGLTCLVLAVNKQLDAQRYLVEGTASGILDAVVRWLRDAAPGVLVLGLVVCATVSATALVWATSGMERFRLATVGILVVVLIALMRSTQIVRLGPASVRLDHDAALPFELVGSIAVVAAAIRHVRAGYESPCRRTRHEGRSCSKRQGTALLGSHRVEQCRRALHLACKPDRVDCKKACSAGDIAVTDM